MSSPSNSNQGEVQGLTNLENVENDSAPTWARARVIFPGLLGAFGLAWIGICGWSFLGGVLILVGFGGVAISAILNTILGTGDTAEHPNEPGQNDRR